MENDMVKQKLHEYSHDLYRLTDRVMAETDYKVRFVRCSGTGLYCRVYVAGPGQELTDDGNSYSLYVDPSRWEQTRLNYQRCKSRLVGILVTKKP